MPSLEHLDSKNTLNVMLNGLVGGRGVPGLPGRPQGSYAARLLDKTILSYESARVELTKYVQRESENTMAPLVRALDHLETTVDSLYRLSCFIERLRRNPAVPEIDAALLPSKVAKRRIRAMRNAIQHADEHIHEGRLEESWLLVCEDRVELARHVISYDELAAWIEGFHDTLKPLLAYLPAVPQQAAAGKP
jgi:hypothetical protein